MFEIRKDVKRATLHDKAHKRTGGYAVDFINLQPQEKIVTMSRETTMREKGTRSDKACEDEEVRGQGEIVARRVQR